MADVSRRLFLRHLRSNPTSWVRHSVKGTAQREGVGLAFWYRPLTAVLSEVPVDDRELPLLFHARTSDFTDVTVQATVTYRVAEPALAVARLDFSIDPYQGAARGRPLDQIATLLAELAQQPALDLLARLPLAEALTEVAAVREAVSSALSGEPRLTDLGVQVVSARVVAIRPEPELERALQTPTREAVQAEADRATFARRAQAVEQERGIAENELQNKIELARREQQLVEQNGANARRAAELDANAQLAATQGKAERGRLLTAAEAEKDQLLAEAKAAGVRALGVAQGEAEAAKLAAYREIPPAVLHALALRELAGQLPQIGQLTVTPDVVTGLLARFGAENPGR
ncbi:regulator of protease activity HflC (stomatin/prohibitin superfamily) [Allocatelliglobosispora scoriae]|uniref:Regulator of protease activity HflC (Stomatin/prohibitin superfamily) n=1 Tax=Allocatelliglobosispora scoriae TaxID=643052 RepID=A0A841BLK5_9ACTN|nr:SPFH domain-containing protein [Allocatelliglobosispora scoriae]MBB5868525.1 regulator of protease activity HflC (stomatin/prohibitin superfamily) [Allocatelliglobosispora scoriae]